MADVVEFRPRRETEPEPLWREELGRSLRAIREDRGDRLVDVAERAGVSPQYLSEIERGRKEPSSEMIAAVTGALGIDLADLLGSIAGQVRRSRPAAPAPVGRPAGPLLIAA
ncbi:helix-turn-helix domain-containing protein [Saccharopolyspora endophytica]|uniref:Helix-turn-helix transcriptional regulator n=1 Tax=Saccharopolyspora endophytica TaxID=543886 RepID=A0ABS5DQ63_9PSEU|nr:helix-turn-helix transcriptional regulator [Saccharopolyspora endophytica]MBQ0928435.1 helix-turn-helix transcriptional regulator [Saccharopolyspora endophytica]